MPGALLHIAAGIICAVVIHLIHFKWEYSYSIFIGNLLPDAIKFGITGLMQKNLNPCTINTRNGLFHFLSGLTGSFNFWFTAGFFVLAITLLLYHHHIIKKKKMAEYDKLYGFLLIGVVIHLIMDVFIMERGCLF